MFKFYSCAYKDIHVKYQTDLVSIITLQKYICWERSFITLRKILDSGILSSENHNFWLGCGTKTFGNRVFCSFLQMPLQSVYIVHVCDCQWCFPRSVIYTLFWNRVSHILIKTMRTVRTIVVNVIKNKPCPSSRTIEDLKTYQIN